jgi:hypothetical protein
LGKAASKEEINNEPQAKQETNTRTSSPSTVASEI